MDLIRIERRRCVGVVAVEIDSGELHVFHGKAVLFATGGWGRVWEITSNAHSLTGDGNAIALSPRAVPMQDMEFFQFHPTGIYKMGILITEGVRGEGGVLINGEGERFMERYAPTIKDLASRDVVTRAIYLEMQAGRGIKGKDYVHLDVTPETVNRYFGWRKTGRGAAPHHARGHRSASCPTSSISAAPIWASIRSASRCPSSRPRTMPWAASRPTSTGGCCSTPGHAPRPACTRPASARVSSVHGANRLGTNSLIDLIVFGRRAGKHMVQYCQGLDFTPLPNNPGGEVEAELERLRSGAAARRAADLREQMQHVMMDHVGVFRTAEGMQEALDTVRRLKDQYRTDLGIDDRGKRSTAICSKLGAGLPARHRRGDRGERPGPRREPRRALARGFPQARR